MEVLFFTDFSKRKNSTKQPNDEDGVLKNVVLKDNTDKTNPTFMLASTDEYVYCKAWGMYYFIHRIGYSIDGAQIVYCNIDVLATWKSEILATSAYIVYSSTGFNRWIKDDRCPIIIKNSDYLSTSSAIVIGDTPVFTASDDECIVLTTVSESFGIWSWVLTESELEFVMAHMFMDSNIIDALTKQFGDMMGAIVSVIRLPISKSLLADPDTTHHTQICFGSVSQGTTDTYPWLTTKHIKATGSIGVPVTYTDYRFTEPYCKATLTLPFIGSMSIPLSMLAPEGGINWQLDIDVLTGICTYTLHSDAVSNVITQPLATYSGYCGGNVPVANIQVQSLTNTTRGMMVGMGASALTAIASPVAGIAGGLASIVGGFFGYSQDQANVIGSYSGGRSEYAQRLIRLVVEKFTTSNEPDNLTALEGRPVCKVDTVSNYSGYIQTKKFAIDISSLDVFKQMINDAMDNGVYLE